jgi:hypothetical protein
MPRHCNGEQWEAHMADEKDEQGAASPPGEPPKEPEKPKGPAEKEEKPAEKAALAAPPMWCDLFASGIKSREERQGLEVERALHKVRCICALAVVFTLAYGLWAGGIQGACIAVLGGGAAFAIGSLLGFLFGLPRYSEPTKDNKPSARTNPDGAAGTLRGVVPNTNLERIMDWLTTLIVGLGLVHWEPAMKAATSTSVWFTQAIVQCGTACGTDNGSPGAAILVTFVIAGFVTVYLWASRYMATELSLAELESARVRELEDEVARKRKEAEEAKKSEEQARREAQKLNVEMTEKVRRQNEAAEKTEPPESLPPVVGAENLQAARKRKTRRRYELSELSDVVTTPALPQDLIVDLRRRYAENTGYNDEPLAGFGPAEAGGLRLEGSVDPSEGGGFFFKVRLTVRGVSLTDDVAFFLHHTLPHPIRVDEADDNNAAIDVRCAGSFIAGAYCARTGVRLSLDLAKLPGAPKEFRDN